MIFGQVPSIQAQDNDFLSVTSYQTDVSPIKLPVKFEMLKNSGTSLSSSALTNNFSLLPLVHLFQQWQ